MCSGKGIGGELAEAQTVEQPFFTRRLTLLDPSRTFDHEQTVKRLPVRREPGEQFGERRDSAHNERVESPSLENFLRGHGMHNRLEPNFGDDRLEGASLLSDRLAESNPQVGAQYRQDHSRHTTPRADIEHLFAFGEELRQFEAVDDVARNEFVITGVASQVDFLIPIP